MAYYAALASLVQLLDDIILHHRYPAFLLASHPLVKSLHQKFTSLEESLQHYSSNGDELNHRFEGRIRDVAYLTQDIIEIEISDQRHLQELYSIFIELRMAEHEADFILEELKSIKERQRSEGSELNWDSPALLATPTTGHIIKETKMSEQEIDSILEESASINLTCSEKRMNLRKKCSPMSCFGCFRGQKFNKEYSIKKCSPMSCSASVQTPATKNIMVGFDEALNIIKDHLCGQSSQLQVISTVGMGRIGKTTLARNAFDDALVAYYFDCGVWVTVSQEYHENKVLQIISESLELLMKELPGDVGGDLKERIYKCLKGKRYLIVIDDIWETEVWDDVRRISPNDSNGSRIMLTTRLLKVARYANPVCIHEMQFLNEDESWNFLQKKVFEQECCPPELENIGMFIASKCCGLPLAVLVIAGILSRSKTLHHWDNIAGKVRTMLGITDEQINRILALSYNHLSHQLKACFLYLGSFPKDYEIDIANLVRLWITDGFLKSNDSSKLAEKVGEECVEDLMVNSKFVSYMVLYENFVGRELFMNVFFM